MQTLIHVFCQAGPSLRDKIAKDERRLKKFELYVESQKTQARARGWTKVKSLGAKNGAINLDWDRDAMVLVCRVVTRGSGDPAPIVGDLVSYLLSHHFARFRMLTIVPEAGK
ncbi:MAG: hypothetical protein ABIT20_14455 [Gemmatimonadaceae bacterium]